MKTTLLCILDGFGLNPNPSGNAVALAKKPVIDRLMKTLPNSTLVTFGERVGLPEGQMGNSEVGHLNIGAGRVVEQWLVRISRELREDNLPKIPEYQHFRDTTQHSRALHLFGLYSDGGVHSHMDHLSLLLKRVHADFPGKIVLHLITDGRDTSPESGKGFVSLLSAQLENYPRATIGTICGRFFAMDRDKRWERTKKAYDLYVSATGEKVAKAGRVFENSYAKGITDEFIEPSCLDHDGIHPGDAAMFWNFREDRMRQLVRSLCIESFDGFERKNVPFSRERVLTFTDIDHTFELPYLFPQIEIKNHLGEVVSKAGLKQLRVAETEKYPHVTYFLNGGIESQYNGESRTLIPSPREVRTYDLKPEMSAYPVTDVVVDAIASNEYALIVVNFANADMVGHSGILEAGIKAVETVDTCLGKVLNALERVGGQAIILADHGNAEQMINYEDGTPQTAHTTYPVPVILFGCPGVKSLRDGGALSDVAPTVLKMMGLDVPTEMTGKSLY